MRNRGLLSKTLCTLFNLLAILTYSAMPNNCFYSCSGVWLHRLHWDHLPVQTRHCRSGQGGCKPTTQKLYQSLYKCLFATLLFDCNIFGYLDLLQKQFLFKCELHSTIQLLHWLVRQQAAQEGGSWSTICSNNSGELLLKYFIDYLLNNFLDFF